MTTAAEVFADVVRALEAYAEEIVLIGGWVHAIYLADADVAARAIRTDDIDITIPHQLQSSDRPTLIELAESVGFDCERLESDQSGLVRLTRRIDGSVIVDLDIITEATTPRDVVPIEGQSGLVVQGYPSQELLLNNTVWIEVGAEVHPSLETPVWLRVPTHAAYVLQKGISAQTRLSPTKCAKDLMYLYEIATHPRLGPRVMAGMPALRDAYREEFDSVLRYLQRLADGGRPLNDLVQQLVYAGRSFEPERDLVARVAAQFSRICSELAECGKGEA